MEAALKAQGKITKVLAFGGDGGTFDIGFQALSGMLERGHNVLYVCYDNEAYMNTGIQRSQLDAACRDDDHLAGRPGAHGQAAPEEGPALDHRRAPHSLCRRRLRWPIRRISAAQGAARDGDRGADLPADPFAVSARLGP